MVEELTGVKVLTLHHDVSIVIGEEAVVFLLTRAPDFREVKKR